MATPKTWYRGPYMISTEPHLIQPSAVNAAFASDEMPWAKELELPLLTKMLSNSRSYTLYKLPDSSAELAGRSNLPQVGLARLITDEVRIAYLTDVYVLLERKGKGLGTWLMECAKEDLESWPNLRRCVLMADDKGKDFYTKTMGFTTFEPGKDGYYIVNKNGKKVVS